jgi:myo-inositol-1-phosphate synthase
MDITEPYTLSERALSEKEEAGTVEAVYSFFTKSPLTRQIPAQKQYGRRI